MKKILVKFFFLLFLFLFCSIVREGVINIKNCNLLLNKNEKSSYYKNNRKIVIQHKASLCNGFTINKLIKEINGALEKFPNFRLKFVLDFENVKFWDKLTYIILECICYSLIADGGHVVTIRGLEIPSDIFLGGLINSPLRLLNSGKTESQTKYIEIFDKKMLSKNHYRRIILSSEKSTSTVFCNIMAEVKTFLMLFCDSIEYRKEVAEIVSELAGNAWEHAKSDCLIDIDVQEGFSKTGEKTDAKYYGVNIVVVNLSDILLGDEIKSKILNTELTALDDRCRLVKKALETHKKMFDTDYDENDFFNLASFQDRVSGRVDSGDAGGRGLPLLIKSLEKQADTHLCYVLSGRNVIWFKTPFLEYNDDKWVGFNAENDFLSIRPDKECLGRCAVFVSGTAFNLNFAMKTGG